jgi:hypothetical protein
MAPADLSERSNVLTRDLPHFQFTPKRRPAIALIGLAVVLLAVISGAEPATASSTPPDATGSTAAATAPTSEASATTAPPDATGSTAALSAPTGLMATVVSSSEIDLSWTPPRGESPAGYDVYSGTSAGGEDPTPVNSTGLITHTTFKVTGLDSSTTYYFVVDAAAAKQNPSVDSNEAWATTAAATGSTAPEGPTGSPGGSAGPGGVILLLVIIAAIACALIVRRRRKQRTSAPQFGPGSSVQAVAHAGPPSPVTIHTTGKGASLTVRIEPRPSPGVTTIEEAPPR